MPRRGSSPRALRWRWWTHAGRSARGGAVRAIADAVEANAAALLVLVSRKDAAALDAFHQYGATHFLVSPFTEPQLLHALLFAQRHAERAGGGGSRRGGEQGEAESWRWQPGSRSIELSPALARQAGLGEDDGRRISLMELFRKTGPRRPPRGAARSTGCSPPARRPPSPIAASGRRPHRPSYARRGRGWDRRPRRDPLRGAAACRAAIRSPA